MYYGEGRNSGGGGSASKDILVLSFLVAGELEGEEDDESEVVVDVSFDGFASLVSSSSQTASDLSFPNLAVFKRAGMIQLQ